MRKIFKYLRNTVIVNWLFRILLENSSKVLDKFIARWPVSGIVQLSFNGLKFKMFSKGDDTIVNLLYYRKHYHESKDLKFFLQLAKRSKVIFDIGANTGVYSCLSSKINPQAVILAFEPYPVNIGRLKANTRLNNLTNVTIVEKAVGDCDKTISFAVPVDDGIADTSSADINFSKSTYNGDIKWKTIAVEQLSLDNFFQKNNLKVDLIKIDVEGYEEAVFTGGKDFFTTQSPLIQCEIILNDQKKQYFENFLRETGYYAYMILNDGLLRTDQTLDPNPGSLNYFFAKKRTRRQFISYEEAETLLSELI